jgi:hypothetical protein
MTDETLPELPEWNGQVIEVVPRGTRPVGEAGEGGSGAQQEDGAASATPPPAPRRVEPPRSVRVHAWRGG